jgi:hypothetical protein
MTDEWTNKALDTVDRVVATVHDKVVRPAVVGARGVVFGVIIGVAAIAMVVLLSVGIIRLITIGTGHVWISYLAVGALFCLLGAFAYSKRVAPPGNG